MVDIWFESHGTTLDNETKHASGWNDVDLSELGVRQSIELLDRCRERQIEAIFCSDLQRSVKTGVPTAESLRIPLYVDRRLRECDYGEMTGQPSSLIESERKNRINIPFPNGESYQETLQRMQRFMADLKRDFEGKTVLVIGHRATQYGIEVCTFGKALEDCIAQGNEHWKWQPGWMYELK